MDRPVVDRLMLQRLLALFGAGVLLFNFPLLPVALFGAWALLIALLAVLMERRQRGS
jgi:hypothetical protein